MDETGFIPFVFNFISHAKACVGLSGFLELGLFNWAIRPCLVPKKFRISLV